MMMSPDHITTKMFAEALEKIRAKRPSLSVEKLRLERFANDLCIQTMHIGPYAAEQETIERMNAPGPLVRASPRKTATPCAAGTTRST
jgi:hypothetical protein